MSQGWAQADIIRVRVVNTIIRVRVRVRTSAPVVANGTGLPTPKGEWKEQAASLRLLDPWP